MTHESIIFDFCLFLFLFSNRGVLVGMEEVLGSKSIRERPSFAPSLPPFPSSQIWKGGWRRWGGCPNARNPFHECNDWCRKHWETSQRDEVKIHNLESAELVEDTNPLQTSLPTHFGAPTRKRNFPQHARYTAVPPPSSGAISSSETTLHAADKIEPALQQAPSNEEIAAANHPRVRKLMELKQKMSKALILNRAEVRAEAVGKSRSISLTELGGRAEKVKGEEEEEEEGRGRQGRRRKDARQLLQTSVEDAEWNARKRKRKGKKSRVLVDFGVEQSKKTYDQRLSQLPVNGVPDEYERQKESVKDFYRGADSLEYGNWSFRKENLGRMVKEVNHLVEKRTKYSRRREFYDAADVTYINERNRKYNEKISRFYDDYTIEIRQNLERGTAL